MLEKVRTKMSGTDLGKRIELHRCSADRIGVTEKVDFVLAFWMVHEVPDHEKLFEELNSIVKPEGRIFIIEPIFHVTKNAFSRMLQISLARGFTVTERPKLVASRAVVLKKT